MDKNQNIQENLSEFSKRELGDIKVLMIEDDILISEVVLTQLSKEGCVPYSTANGSEAIALAERFAPDVIILDLMLPGMNGEEVLGALKANENLKDIPVIVFSNRSEEEDKQKALALGAKAYFVKASTEFKELADEVKKLANQ